MQLPPTPWRLLVVAAVLGVLAGGVWGFVRGLGYLPTLPFAVVEGGFIVGVPAVLAGLLLVASWSLVSALRRRVRATRERPAGR